MGESSEAAASAVTGKETKKKDKKKVKKKKKERKKKRSHREAAQDNGSSSPPQEKNSHKRRRKESSPVNPEALAAVPSTEGVSSTATLTVAPKKHRPLTFDHRYIMAPMVGASELPFRLLSRQYGTQLCYTPMWSAHKLVHDEAYRQETLHFCHAADRPLVVHVAANTPADLAAAATLVAQSRMADALDLNLGCPQRTAYVGHFGSYLLGSEDDRRLVCDMIRAAVQATADAPLPLPILAKIRLLDTLDETVQLCRQLEGAGASLIAVHARYRASWQRKGPGARDGPALLDQVAAIKRQLRIPVVTNGNTIAYDPDVVENLRTTQADGLMSAEGILDNPALFLPRLLQDGHREHDADTTTPSSTMIPWILPVPPVSTTSVAHPSPASTSSTTREPPISSTQPPPTAATTAATVASPSKLQRKWLKKLRQIARLEEQQNGNSSGWTAEEKALVAKKKWLQEQVAQAEEATANTAAAATSTAEPSPPAIGAHTSSNNGNPRTNAIPTHISLVDLQAMADARLPLAFQYLDLVDLYPVPLRTVIFHIRRMCKDWLVRYQLLDTLVALPATATVDDVRSIVRQVQGYQANPASFVYDQERAAAAKAAADRQRQQEGQRRAFEDRMRRKAKREGRLDDLDYYLHQGAVVPTTQAIAALRSLPRRDALAEWQRRQYGQHCLSFHLDGTCARGRACAFLHVDAAAAHTFDEQHEVAG